MVHLALQAVLVQLMLMLLPIHAQVAIAAVSIVMAPVLVHALLVVVAAI